jgi:threonine/homoserine/homoserine lactone efflux protein
MIDASVLPGFLLAVFLVTIAPGPDNTYIAAVALQRGSRAGVLSAIGMAIGMVVHVCAVSAGLAVLLRSSSVALTAVQLVGGGYLGWLAVSTLREVRATQACRRPPATHVLRRAVITNLTNPKVILFFAAFLPEFTRRSAGPVWLQLLTLGVIFLAIGFTCDVVIGVVAGQAGVGARSGWGGKALTVVASMTFATLSVLLLVDAARG